MQELNRLVIFGTRVGLHFSGGSNATVKLFQHIVPEFQEVIVVAKEFGPLHFSGTHSTIHWEEEDEAIKILQGLKTSNCIFYGDFWDSIYLVKAQVPFFFTYHDNWPEQKALNLHHWYKSFEMLGHYRQIFKAAEHVFSVTQHKRNFIGRSTQRHSLAYNGACLPQTQFAPKSRKKDQVLKILMLGNVDLRKYKLALRLFSHLDSSIQAQISVDIYGHMQDIRLYRKLSKFPFVKLQGFTDSLDFGPYDLLLSCSQAENLPISMLEALLNYTPVMSFDIGGISELVQEGRDGILIRPYDTSQMARALEKLVLGSSGFSFNREKLRRFDWKESASLMLDRFRASLHA